ncbi:MAG: hypothetical protein OZ935_12905 [Pseudomonadota bacterium]|nr:hypothetical protein [Pseudomonadota bacterium]
MPWLTCGTREETIIPYDDLSQDGFLGAGDPGALDALYRQFLDDPHSVPRDMARRLAQLFETGGAASQSPVAGEGMALLAEAWRHRGHLAARLDPLGLTEPEPVLELHPGAYGLPAGSEAGLRAAYGGSIGWEYGHVHDGARRAWLQAQAEGAAAMPSEEERLALLCLLERGHALEGALRQAIRDAFDAANDHRVDDPGWFRGALHGYRSAGESGMSGFVETGLDPEELRAIGSALTTPPEDYALDSKVVRFLDRRRASIETGEGIDWATGEALGLASLLAEGFPLRFSGQDSMRGAFTQRHLFVHDTGQSRRHCVLDPLAEKGGVVCEAFNTPLIEHAVLAFEYGLSLADPKRLVVWEAQFGDFLNVAQPAFDQFVVCGEDRWLRCSSLVMLLPHGLDGGGPDHSTGYPERLLGSCARGNIQVVNVSTPANFFHLLRRQMKRDFRKPLVVLTPKALLRNKACVSTLAEFGPGTGFRTLIPDDAVQQAAKLILCTGKIHYELAADRKARGLDGSVALARLEQLYPLPEAELKALFDAHPKADLVWCQEEPANMGYFTHLDRQLERLAGRPLRYAGRPAVPTPAVGVKHWRESERDAVLEAALG